ncbi:hydroxylamine reductase [Fusobacterium varium]|uniref:hydroxylamine reductase n=1 Tax=Fusobacterium varium TaxID=856 RepID=UPI000E4BBCD4|nr:hydroxylamine reductase [Fusobacterium varium]RHG34409.1 hydroxylamine reductase [Fusobacterium varium]
MCNQMFCFQCQETMKGTGCTIAGVCGKQPITASLQDLLVYTVKGVAAYSSQLRKIISIDEILKTTDRYIINSLFMTITNANFDNKAIINEIKQGLKLRNELRNILIKNSITLNPRFENIQLTTWTYLSDEELIEFSKNHSIGILRTENEDIRSLRELLTYGLKGMAAYAEHAMNLNKTNEEIFTFMEKALLATLDDTLSGDDLTALVLECGAFGVKTMALLDEANTSAFGNPEITKVNIGVGNRPGILISGHDLNDLEQLLEQSKDSGVDIYTHSEMLPGHYYPKFKKYSHFFGNYGNAWWKQKEEFETFNGPVVFTTNCIVPPLEKATYNDRIFTTNATGFPNWKRIPVGKDGKKDFSEVIALAKKCKAPTEIEKGEIIGGFAHNQVFALADKVVEAVKSGAIKKFVVMAGCDGRMSNRNYYTDFAKALPKDTVILTAGCAKYKYNKLSLGDINGIPRVLDAGQCNDSYSLALIALKLKEIFGLDDINKLPIVYNIAWYEQKAVIVLLALLSLGVKNIHIGPTLPAFLSPNVLNVLINTFGLAGISDVENDLAKFDLK